MIQVNCCAGTKFLRFEGWWEFIEHLVRVHCLSREAANTKVVDMIAWKAEV